MRQAYDYWQNQPDCSWFCSNLTTHTSPRLPATRAFRTGREGIGKVVTFKLGYVRSVSFLQPVSVRRKTQRVRESSHGRLSGPDGPVCECASFNCSPLSLSLSRHISEGEGQQTRKGRVYVAPCHRMPVAFRKKRNFTPVSQRYFPSADVVSEMRGFHAQSTASPYRPDCGTQNPVISAAAGLMRMVLFRRLRISYQHKQSNLRLEYSRRPKTGQTLVQDRRTS